MNKAVKFLKMIPIFFITGISVSQENGNIYTSFYEWPINSGPIGTYQISPDGLQGQMVMPSVMVDMTNEGSKILFRDLIYNSGEIDSINLSVGQNQKVRFTNDENIIVFKRDEQIFKYSFSEGSETLIVDNVRSFLLSPNKEELLSTRDLPDVDSLDLVLSNIQTTESNIIRRIPNSYGFYWAQDNYLYYSSGLGLDSLEGLQKVNIYESNEPPIILVEDASLYIIPTDNPLSEKLILNLSNIELWVFDLLTTNLTYLADIPNYDGYSLNTGRQALSPDFSKVAITTWSTDYFPYFIGPGFLMIIDIDTGDINLLEEYHHPPNFFSGSLLWLEPIQSNTNPLIHQIDDKEFLEDQPEMIEIPFEWNWDFGTVTIKSDIDTSILNFEYQTAFMPSGLIWINYNVEENWNGSANIEVTITDEGNLSDSMNFALNILPVNDPPESFSLIYPTINDTIQISNDPNDTFHFNWQESVDIDSDVNYIITINLDYFGNYYSSSYESNDSYVEIASDEWAELIDFPWWTLEYVVEATDGEYTVESEIGQFVFQKTSLSNESDLIPLSFNLHQNYPNPFNPFTTLRYDLLEDGLVNITIYDMLGNVINQLVNEVQSSGYKSIQWNATNNLGQPVSAGVYLYSIEAGDFRKTKKMILLK